MPRVFCQECVFKARDEYKRFHNHYWRTQMTDHTHSLMLINKLETLTSREAVLRKPHVTNVLNDIYEEGLKAHSANHFLERHFVDLTFGASCDGCKKEIEFLLFVCLGCRNYSICEKCYFK